MEPRRLVRALLLAIGPALFLASPAISQTPKEWQKVIRRIDALQANPLAPDRKEQGAWLVKWLTKQNDVSITLCADLTVPLTDKGDDVAGFLILHSLLGAGRYALTVPLDQQSKLNMYMASINGALDAYQKMTAADEKYRRKSVDEVTAQRDADKLEAYVRDHSKQCAQ
jgi:hypothetical protein